MCHRKSEIIYSLLDLWTIEARIKVQRKIEQKENCYWQYLVPKLRNERFGRRDAFQENHSDNTYQHFYEKRKK